MNKDFDSSEEMYFSWYLDELVEAAYIDEYKLHPQGFTLSSKHLIETTKQLKTKTKIIVKTFLNPHIYSPDFYIKWFNRSMGVFVSPIKGGAPFWLAKRSLFPNYYSYIEIKPTFSRFNMARIFSLNQKWVFDRHDIYVQLIKPLELFKKTFTPGKYLITDKSGKPRKLSYDPIELKKFLSKTN